MDESIGPGRRLRSEREALGVSVREVADTLNLSITVVQALEDDDYKQLEQMASFEKKQRLEQEWILKLRRELYWEVK